MATFIQTMAQHGLRLTRVARLWLGMPAVRPADIAGARTGAVMRGPCQLQAALRPGHGRGASVAGTGIATSMSTVRAVRSTRTASRPNRAILNTIGTPGLREGAIVNRASIGPSLKAHSAPRDAGHADVAPAPSILAAATVGKGTMVRRRMRKHRR